MNQPRRFVVKVGSRVLLAPDKGEIDPARIDALCEEVASLASAGFEPVIVTSGAIACGVARLKFRERPRDLARLQAAAAAGQIALMRHYEEALSRRGLVAAQVLLTHSDVADRRRYINARSTFRELIAQRAIPIVNENDTVATREIRFGDNDALSAEVAAMAGADLLILLTDVPALLDADPRLGAEGNGGRPPARIPIVRDAAAEAAPLAGGGGGGVGTGGMATKVEAARRASAAGIPTIVADGRRRDILQAIFTGEDTGTLFLAGETPLNARKAWIANTLKPQGKVVVDAGAVEALGRRGKSLLPSGIRAIEGDFARGAAVSICAPDGREVARGLSSYDARDLARIAGRRSEDALRVLGYVYDEAIHRDDLAVLPGAAAEAEPEVDVSPEADDRDLGERGARGPDRAVRPAERGRGRVEAPIKTPNDGPDEGLSPEDELARALDAVGGEPGPGRREGGGGRGSRGGRGGRGGGGGGRGGRGGRGGGGGGAGGRSGGGRGRGR